jgi:hypothetical protein
MEKLRGAFNKYVESVRDVGLSRSFRCDPLDSAVVEARRFAEEVERLSEFDILATETVRAFDGPLDADADNRCMVRERSHRELF